MYAKLVAFFLFVAIFACLGVTYVAGEPGYRRHYGGYGHGGGGGGGHRGGYGGYGGGHRGYGYGR